MHASVLQSEMILSTDECARSLTSEVSLWWKLSMRLSLPVFQLHCCEAAWVWRPVVLSGGSSWVHLRRPSPSAGRSEHYLRSHPSGSLGPPALRALMHRNSWEALRKHRHGRWHDWPLQRPERTQALPRGSLCRDTTVRSPMQTLATWTYTSILSIFLQTSQVLPHWPNQSFLF